MTTTAPPTAPAASPDTTSPAARVKALLLNQQFILVLVWIVMIAVFTALNSVFFSVGVAGNVLADWGPVVLIAVGETYVVISGGIDLSVGATLGLAGVVGAYAMREMTANDIGSAPTLIVGLLVCLTIGALVGLVNALLINKAKLVPFIATLATLGAAGGLSIVLTGGAPIGAGPSDAIKLTIPKFGPISYPTIVVAIVVVLCGLFLHQARFGRYTFAIGSNPFAARAAGIDVERHLTKVYMLSGILAGLAGFYLYLRLGSGAPTSGKGGELQAIAAVVIGGASLAGGIGRLSGTVIGAFILTTVTSGLIIVGVNPNWKDVVVAILIATAVATQALRLSVRK